MLSYCFKFRKNTKSKNPEIVNTKNGRIMLLSKCAVCNSKISKFLKEQEARGLLSNLKGVKIHNNSYWLFHIKCFILKV